MRLRVLAPTAIDLFLRPGAAVRDPDGYQAFWQACEKAIAKPAARTPTQERPWLPHASRATPYNRYSGSTRTRLTGRWRSST